MTELEQAVANAMQSVIDPELRRPITDLDMVREVSVADGKADISIDLTVAGCPLQNTIKADATKAALEVDGITDAEIHLGVMNEEQRKGLREKLSGPTRQVPFAQPNSLTRVIAVASGKGGVGKSSVTANLAVAMAKEGLKVGVVDADIYGFSIPRMLGVEHEPTMIDGMIVPPVAHDVKVMSIGMFVPDGQPVVWRGPMLHRALQQFLTDVYWGDLDVLLLDLPPGTGDVALSIAQLLPGSEILLVTTPQIAAAEVAERSGSIAAQTHQRVIGVVENMAYMQTPDGQKIEVFGSGGGEMVSARLATVLGYPVDLLAQIPLDVDLRIGGDNGTPVALSDGPAASALQGLAKKLSKRSRGLSGRNLGVSPL